MNGARTRLILTRIHHKEPTMHPKPANRDNCDSANGHWWLAGAALSSLFYVTLLGYLDQRDTGNTAAVIAAATQSAVQARGQAAAVSLAHCPPPAADRSDSVVMVIRSRPDAQPTVESCWRAAINTTAPWLQPHQRAQIAATE